MADPFTYDDNNSDDYLWVLILGGIFCFLVAYGIGANDVANAFGSSVGSKALKIWQALIIAGIFEFLGALLLGKGVTKTIRKGIAEVEVFRRDPEVLMFGMLCVLAATGVWLLVASYLELPVSTTHSTVGGIIGMALAAYGNDAVVWYKKDTDAFPPFKGVTAIIVSWVLSPVFSGIFASILFLVTKYLVLIHENSFIRTWIFFPFLVFVTLGINSFFIIYKGAAGIDELKDLPTGEAFMWAAIVGVVGGIGAGALGWYYLKPKVEAMYTESADTEKGAKTEKGDKEGAEADPKAVEMTTTNGETTEAEAGVFKKAFASVKNYFERNQNAVHGVVDTDDTVHGIHESTRVYDDSTEEAFKYLQVFTAICDSFAHGANDVANSIGPFAAIYGVYKNNQVSKNSDVPRWILAYGGIGIVIGLATYGYNIIRAIGVKLTKITPSRGYAIELGAALVVVIGSRLEIPLSTTHCQVGATVGVGLADTQGVKGVNWSLFLKVVFGWIITLVVVGFSTALLFALGAYSPGLNEIGQRNSYENGLWVNSELMIMRLNETLDFNDTSAWTDAERNLNATLFELRDNTTTLFRTPFLKGANFVPQFETNLDTFAEGFNAALDVALRPELHTAAADENIPPKPFN